MSQVKKVKKQRINVDLAPELIQWAESTAIKFSGERGKRVSRNQVIAEALEFYRKHLEGDQTQKIKE